MKARITLAGAATAALLEVHDATGFGEQAAAVSINQVVDDYWGQDWQSVMQANAAQIAAADPQDNVLFSIHMYEVYGSASAVTGYIGWSYSGNSGGTEFLDMTNGFNPDSLTSWGQRIFNGTNGIAGTAQCATVFDCDGGPGTLAPGQSASFGFDGAAASAGNNPVPTAFTC